MAGEPGKDQEGLALDLTDKLWNEFLDKYDPDNGDDEANSVLVTLSISSYRPTAPSFRVDVRDLPNLPTSKSAQSAFGDWDNAFCAKMHLTKCGIMTNEATVIPLKGNPDYPAYKERDNFVKLALLTAANSTTAFPYMDLETFRRNNWILPRKTYKGDGYMSSTATDALNNLD